MGPRVAVPERFRIARSTESLASIFDIAQESPTRALLKTRGFWHFLSLGRSRESQTTRRANSVLGMCDTPHNDVLAAFGLSLPSPSESVDAPSPVAPKKKRPKPTGKRARAQVGEFAGNFDLIGKAKHRKARSGKRITQYRFRCVRCDGVQIGEITKFRKQKLKCPKCDEFRKPLLPGEVAGDFEFVSMVGDRRPDGGFQMLIRCVGCGHERVSRSNGFRAGFTCQKCQMRKMPESYRSLVGGEVAGFTCLRLIRAKGTPARAVVRCSSCQDERVVTVVGYRQGLVCSRCGMGGARRRDYTGQRIGRYLCTGYQHITLSTGRRSHRWVCVCQGCGAERLTTKTQIDRGLYCRECDGFGGCKTRKAKE